MRSLPLLGLLALFLAACSTLTAETGATRTPPHLVRVWSFDDITPESAVQVVDGVAVGYGTQHGQLVIFGLDATTGRLLWRHAASMSRVTEGVAVQVSVVHDAVVYFGPYQRFRDEAAQMISADPRSGQTRSATRPLPWSRVPYACPRAPARICSTTLGAGGVSVEWSVDPDTGAVSSAGDQSSGGRDIGADLIDPLQREPELIERRIGERRIWLRRAEEIFGPGVSTDHGWLFDKYGDTYAGTLGAPGRMSPDKRTYVEDLARSDVSAGFRASDGALLWRARGTYVACNGVLERDDPVPVRCRYRGHVTYRLAADHNRIVGTTTSGLSVVIEGFDPASGRTRWSHDLGAARAMVGDGVVPIASDTQSVVRIAGVYRVLDLRTGATSAASAPAYWCLDDRTFHAVPQAPTEYRVGEVVSACRADGAKTTAVPATAPDAVCVAGPDHVRLVAMADAVVAYRQEG